MLSLVMALCLSAFLMSMTPSVSPEGGEKTHKVKKKKEKKPKKDKKDKKQKQEQQTATPFEVKNEQSNQKQL